MTRKKKKIDLTVPLIKTQTKVTGINPRTDSQREFLNAIKENDIIFVNGPAGTGKTHLSVGVGVQGIKEGAYDKLIITRPVVESGEKLGFLPGDLNDKLNPYMMPIFDELRHFLPPQEIEHWRKSQILEIVPLAYMRGRNFHKSFIILDEAQNTTVEQLKMVLTRIGFYSKMVLAGDVNQTDLPMFKRGGFDVYMSVLKDIEGIAIIDMPLSDIVRNPIITKILEKVTEYENAQKSFDS
jgi:phosphate starvation-inducible PhoH-like protein